MSGVESAELDELAAQFTALRPRLTRIAYAVVGSQAEAEDVVSATWIRLMDAAARGRIDDLEAWCVVAVSRRAMNALRSARTRRETYVGPWLPEPVLGPLHGEVETARHDPADSVTLDDSVRYALLVVLEALTPAERTAWVLHDLFGVRFPEIAAVVGRTPQAVRQLATRARRHVEARAPRLDVDQGTHEKVVRAFLRAARTGDLAGLVQLLDEEVTLTSDGGGQVTAARRTISGTEKVGRFFLAVSAKLLAESQPSMVDVNGAPGLALSRGGTTSGVVSFTIVEGAIQRIDMVVAPSKLPPIPVDGAAFI